MDGARRGENDSYRVEESRCILSWLPSIPSREDQKKIDDFGLGSNFRLVLSDQIGVERIDVLRFFTIADVFVLPSFVEGLPIALLEAVAMGIPSISTNVYGIPEAIKHDETGLLVEPGDADELPRHSKIETESSTA